MQARALIALAVTLVLAVALFAIVYFAVLPDDGSEPSLSNPFQEFSARAQVTTEDGGLPYSAVVYSKLEFEGQRIASWRLEAQIDYVENGTSYRHVYVNGLVYHGVVDGEGRLNASECTQFDQGSVLEAGSQSFVPVLLPPDERDLAIECANCSRWSLMLASETFLLLERQGVPQWLVSRDLRVNVTFFQYGNRSVDVERPSEAFRSLCFPTSTNDTGANGTNPETPTPDPEPAAARPGIYDQLAAAAVPREFYLGDFVSLAERRAALAAERAARRGGAQLQSCQSAWRGDGRCDSACNNAANNFDNGDCCRGTCTSGRRYPCGAAGYNCLQSAGSKPCLFLHGLGQSGPRSGQLQQSNPPGSQTLSLPQYWANMASELAGVCTAVTYNWQNTNDFGWNDATVQNHYYDAALSTVQAGGVVFAHSMANNILAGACMDQSKCGVSWYFVGGPIRGSKAADTQDQLQSIFGNGATGGTATLVRSFRGLRFGSTQREQLGRTARGRVKGVLCGTAGWGSGGLAGAALNAVKGIVYGWWRCTRTFLGVCTGWENVEADGLVGLDECERYGYQSGGSWLEWYIGGQATSGSSSGNRFFKYDGNHQDMTGARGNHNGILNWYRAMARIG